MCGALVFYNMRWPGGVSASSKAGILNPKPLKPLNFGCAGPKAKRRTQPWGISSALQGWMARVLAPALLRPAVQALVLALFVGVFVLSLASLPRLSKYAPQNTNRLFCACTASLCRWHRYSLAYPSAGVR